MRLLICFVPVTLALALITIPVPDNALANLHEVAIRASDKHLDIVSGDALVARYHIDPAVAKPHFHPLNGPHGAPVTRGFPMIKDDPKEAKDHPHQRAAWFTHGDVIPEGMTLKRRVRNVDGVDFWAEGANQGRIACVHVESPQASGHHAWVSTRNEWRTADGEKIMDETRIIHFHDLGKAKLLVFDIDLHASVAPITFGDTKEGSFGVRVAETMTEKSKQGGILENADGKRTMKECWGMQSDWCDYSGPVGGKTAGIAILDHPQNPSRAYWHSRDYGLMAANPFGRAKSGFPAAKGKTDLVKLAKGEHLKLRYGLLVHPGDAKEGKVAEQYQKFVKLK